MNNIVNIILITMLVLSVLIAVLIVAHKRLPRRLKTVSYQKRWKDLQSLCRDKATWPEALSRADALLSEVLRKRRLKGKSMGERMVTAQRLITNNDAMWYAHNLAKKIQETPSPKLKEIDVKTALLGFRSALKDLGALESPKPSTEATEAEKV